MIIGLAVFGCGCNRPDLQIASEMSPPVELPRCNGSFGIATGSHIRLSIQELTRVSLNLDPR